MKKNLFLFLVPLILIGLFYACDPGVTPNPGGGDETIIPDPGTNPGTNPGADPITDPGTDPGTNPGTNPGTPLRPAIQSPTAVNRWTGTPQIINSNETVGYFGSSVAVSRNGSVIVVGNFRDDRERDADAEDAVHEYYPVTILRYDGTNWNSFTVRPADTTLVLRDIDFGWSVATSADGNTIAIGAKRDGGPYTNPASGASEILNTGAVYIYRWEAGGYAEREKILPPILDAEYPQRNMHFGNSVRLTDSGTRLVVGAPKFDDNDNYEMNDGISRGKVFVFDHNAGTWNGTGIDAINNPNHDNMLNFFGYSVAISADGTRIVAGARKDPGDGVIGDASYVPNAGSAYVLSWNAGSSSWSQNKILSPDRFPDDYFGHSVGISGDGDTVVIGSYRSDPRNMDSGAVYAFTRTGNVWSAGTKVSSLFGQALDQLGYSLDVSYDGSVIVAGYGLNGGTQSYGRVSIFSREPGDIPGISNPWMHENILWAPDYADRDFFGRAVGISADAGVLAVGIPELLDPARPGRLAVYR